jgi:hypothetical protein
MVIAEAGAATPPEISDPGRFGQLIERGHDPFGNPYVVLGDRPAAPSRVIAPLRMGRQTMITLITLVTLAVIAGGVLLAVRLARSEKSVRDFEVLPLGDYDPRIHCFHPAGDCKSGHIVGRALDRIEVTWARWKSCVEAGAARRSRPPAPPTSR